MSQSLSGWDGVFHEVWGLGLRKWIRKVAIPFRVGWGFSRTNIGVQAFLKARSQSLSGWDGVFHVLRKYAQTRVEIIGRNPFQGGMGFFTSSGFVLARPRLLCVAIPFRVGWGFSLLGAKEAK